MQVVPISPQNVFDRLKDSGMSSLGFVSQCFVDQPCVEGSGTPVEYAVKMSQFAIAGMLEQVLARGELTPAFLSTTRRDAGRRVA